MNFFVLNWTNTNFIRHLLGLKSEKFVLFFIAKNKRNQKKLVKWLSGKSKLEHAVIALNFFVFCLFILTISEKRFTLNGSTVTLLVSNLFDVYLTMWLRFEPPDYSFMKPYFCIWWQKLFNRWMLTNEIEHSTQKIQHFHFRRFWHNRHVFIYETKWHEKSLEVILQFHQKLFFNN